MNICTADSRNKLYSPEWHCPQQYSVQSGILASISQNHSDPIINTSMTKPMIYLVPVAHCFIMGYMQDFHEPDDSQSTVWCVHTIEPLYLLIHSHCQTYCTDILYCTSCQLYRCVLYLITKIQMEKLILINDAIILHVHTCGDASNWTEQIKKNIYKTALYCAKKSTYKTASPCTLLIEIYKGMQFKECWRVTVSVIRHQHFQRTQAQET